MDADNEKRPIGLNQQAMEVPHHEGDFGTYFANKIKKLQNDNNSVATSSTIIISHIFENCCVFVNGYTSPPKEEIQRLVISNGGIFHSYKLPTTTHFICENFTDGQVKEIYKKEQFAKYGQGNHRRIHYVKSSWIVDSISHHWKLPEVNYTPIALKGLHGEVIANYFQKSNPIITSSDITKATSNLSRSLDSSMNAEENPEFIADFFKQSRLHFIGMWKSRLPEMVKELMNPSNINSNHNSYINSNNSSRQRVVLHVDMDCFFVSALVCYDPILSQGNIPIGVAHSDKSGYSEISSCNYKAREFGLKNGMFMKDALKKCPNLKIMSYDFKKYEVISKLIYEILYNDITPRPIAIEPSSVDEAYLEFDSSIDGKSVALLIKKLIWDKTSCPASIGIGNNMLLARLATKSAKPNGIFEIDSSTSQSLRNFISNLSLQELPGIGRKLITQIKAHGLEVFSDVWKYSQEDLKKNFGFTNAIAKLLYNGSRGIDDTKLIPPSRQSIGVDINYGIRFQEMINVEEFLKKMATELSKRLQDAGVKCKTITIKVMYRRQDASKETMKYMGHGVCDSTSKSNTIATAINTMLDIWNVVLPLFQHLVQSLKISVVDFRGFGMHASNLMNLSDSKILDNGEKLYKWLQTAPSPTKSNSEVANKEVESLPTCNTIDIDCNTSVVLHPIQVSRKRPKPIGSASFGYFEESNNSDDNTISRSVLEQEQIVDLSLSQSEFLQAIPIELRSEAIQYLHQKVGHVVNNNQLQDKNINSSINKRETFEVLDLTEYPSQESNVVADVDNTTDFQSLLGALLRDMESSNDISACRSLSLWIKLHVDIISSMSNNHSIRRDLSITMNNLLRDRRYDRLQLLYKRCQFEVLSLIYSQPASVVNDWIDNMQSIANEINNRSLVQMKSKVLEIFKLDN